MNIITLATTYR